jgi:hypothetical protein
VDRVEAAAISLIGSMRGFIRVYADEVFTRRSAVRAICHVSITHVERGKIILNLLDYQSVAPVASLSIHNTCSERTCGRTTMRQSFFDMAKSDAHSNREEGGPQNSLSRRKDIEHPWKHKIHEIVVPESSQKAFHGVFRPFGSRAQARQGSGGAWARPQVTGRCQTTTCERARLLRIDRTGRASRKVGRVSSRPVM